MNKPANNVNIKERLLDIVRSLHKYSVVIFLLFLVGIYGFLAFRVISLDQAEPDEAAVTAQLKTASVPHIDSEVVNKILQLKDNSVSVQTLFDEARQNPFQE